LIVDDPCTFLEPRIPIYNQIMNQLTLHENVPLIEVEDHFILDDLYADSRTAQYLLTRLSSTVAVVAPGQIDALQARLLKAGHTPKVLEE
jgi:hypothetical protein